jgi:hypothetical protein
VREADCRDGIEAKQPRCLNASVTGNDLAVIPNENRGVESIALDRAGDLLDLLL